MASCLRSFGLFACCAKILWPWSEDLLERNGENELATKEQFYKTFLSESGWGLTAEFIRRYRDLMSGIDATPIMTCLYANKYASR